MTTLQLVITQALRRAVDDLSREEAGDEPPENTGRRRPEGDEGAVLLATDAMALSETRAAYLLSGAAARLARSAVARARAGGASWEDVARRLGMETDEAAWEWAAGPDDGRSWSRAVHLVLFDLRRPGSRPGRLDWPPGLRGGPSGRLRPPRRRNGRMAGLLGAPGGAMRPTCSSTTARRVTLFVGELGGYAEARHLAVARVGAVEVEEVAEMAIRTTTTEPSPPPQQTRPPRSRGLLIAVLLSLIVAAVAVAGIVAMRSDDKATTGTVIADGSTGTTAPQTEEQKIIAAYRGYVTAVIRANDPPNPGDPLLEVYATGAQLAAARAAIAQKMKDGVVVRTAANSVAETRWVRVLTVSGDTATIAACNVSDGGVVNAATGAPVGPQGVVTLSVNATLTREAGGVWRVSTLGFGSQWQGVAGCASTGAP